MSKQILPHEIAEIVTGLLVKPELLGELDSPERHQAFMLDIGRVVAEHCGGDANVETECIVQKLAKLLLPAKAVIEDNDSTPVQDLADEMARNIEHEKGKFSGNTQRVQINLATFTRMEYGKEIIVPVEFDEGTLNDLTNQAYRDLDASDFSEDAEYWEKVDCRHDILGENKNCLAGMRCPRCLSLGPFNLTTKGPDPEAAYGMGQTELDNAIERGDVSIIEHKAEWWDEGSCAAAGDTEFVSDGYGSCIACSHAGQVKDFRY